MNRSLASSLTLTLVLVATAGCHHVAAPTPPLAGSSTFSFVDAPPPLSASKPQGPADEGPAQPVEVLVVAVPIEPLARPVYPGTALGRETMPVIIGVHIVVDATGRVASVRRSLAVMSTPTPREDAFRDAVEAALAQWRFRPAELRRLRPIFDDAGQLGWALLGREKSDCAFDVSFLFQSNGEVVVRRDA